MTDSEISQHIQFDDDIQPAKAVSCAAVFKKEGLVPSLSEKPTSYDEEERNAAQIADADLNHKKKQVSPLRRIFLSCQRLRLHDLLKCILLYLLNHSDISPDLHRVPSLTMRILVDSCYDLKTDVTQQMDAYLACISK